MKKVGIWLLCLLAMSCSLVDDGEKVTIELVAVGDHVPTFTVNVVAGDRQTTFSSDNLKGETVIVFFHTTCPDCQRDLPILDRYYQEHKDDEDFQMVAISRAENAESVAAYWKANGLSLPYSAQTDRSVYELFATSIIPRVYYCSQGIITRIDIEKVSITP